MKKAEFIRELVSRRDAVLAVDVGEGAYVISLEKYRADMANVFESLITLLED